MTTVRDNREGLDESEETSLGMQREVTPEEMDKLAKIVQQEERAAKAPKDKSVSAAFKSQERTMKAMSNFYSEVAEKNRNRGYKEKALDDPEALFRDCDEYMLFCMSHGIIPTWNLLAVWLNLAPQTLYAEENLSSKCGAVLKKFRNDIFTILEQSTLQREGNPAAGIFFMKSLWGLSDQQPLDINVHTDAGKQQTPREIVNMIDLTPEEISEK
jgi:hypothetical protein